MRKILKVTIISLLILGSVYYVSNIYLSDKGSNAKGKIELKEEESSLEDQGAIVSENSEDKDKLKEAKEKVIKEESKDDDISKLPLSNDETENNNGKKVVEINENSYLNVTTENNNENSENDDYIEEDIIIENPVIEESIEEELILEDLEDVPYYEEMYSKEQLKYFKNHIENGVAVDLIFSNNLPGNDELKGDFLLFDVYFNTHSYDISEENLNEKIVVINDKGIKLDENIKWEVIGGIATGHHVSGKLIVPKIIDDKDLTEAESITIKMTDVAGSKNREFTWTIKELSIKN